MISRGLFVGRFQPFHLGHLATVKFALNRVKELVIVIGSAQTSHEMRNPFTAGERIQMIRNSLVADSEVDIRRILLIPVSDIYIHSLWTYQVDILVPKYDVVFTNDLLTALLFKEREIKVVEPSLYRRKELSATEVRLKMAKDEDWKKLVPFQTAKVVEDIQGVERIKAIFAKHEI
ncbi:MAG TPA: nicotinamide-nucleotide adenylyltransferase [Nitrososphaeraceae archaeon]|nr:nicotinamide-nucleotide adenylyltransferase [Nitrososphaeraceae archaeon]